MSRSMVRFSRWSSRAIGLVAASAFFAASESQAVPIDITDGVPTITGSTTFHMDNIATLGSLYWADFEWDPTSNVFRVSGYGEQGSGPPEDFVTIDPGVFMMGSPADELGRQDDEIPHEVELTRAFYLAETEVTQAHWIKVMGSNPSSYSGCDDCPVEEISWHDAVAYCNSLSVSEGLDPAYKVSGTKVTWDPAANGYRLPTEAEWEYACRAGTTTAFYSGAITEIQCALDPNLDSIGWYCGNQVPNQTKEVGQKLANSWGLYDMSGNVWEWCWDWRGDYSPGTVTDPIGPDSGSDRMIRGGSWRSPARYCRSAARLHTGPGGRDDNIGFRPAMTAH